MPSAALCTHQQTDLEHAHIKRCCPEKLDVLELKLRRDLCRRGVERLRSCSTSTGNTPALPWYIEHGRESPATWLSHNMTFVFLDFLAAKTIENLQHKRHCHHSHVYFVFSLNTLNNRGSCCHIIGVSATSQNNSCFLIKYFFYCFYLFRILNYLNETTWGDLLVKLLKTQNMSDLWWGVMSKWYQTKRLETTNVDSCCRPFLLCSTSERTFCSLHFETCNRVSAICFESVEPVFGKCIYRHTEKVSEPKQMWRYHTNVTSGVAATNVYNNNMTLCWQ